MKYLLRRVLMGFIPVLLFLLSGCGSNLASSGSNLAPQPPASQPSAPVVTVWIVESSISLGAGESHQFSASVTGTSNTAVTWSISGCSGADCGSISSSGYYTAPSSITALAVTQVTATSQADLTKSASAWVTHQPVKTLSSSKLLEGDYAFLFEGWDTYCPQTGCDSVRAALAGQFHADGNGHITSGIKDINIESGKFSNGVTITGSRQVLEITGSYEVENDLRGTLVLISSKGAANYRISISASGDRGTFIAFQAGKVEGLILGSGVFEKQDSVAFTPQTAAGPYAFGLFGDGNRGAVGRFEATSGGTITKGRIDLQRDRGGFNAGYTVTYNVSGEVNVPSLDTGRGSMTLNLFAENGTPATLHFTYYVVSADKILLLEIDNPAISISGAAPILSGPARRQYGVFSAASFQGPSIFNIVGAVPEFGYTYPSVDIGQLTADGVGSLSGVLDRTLNSLTDEVDPVANFAFTGSYTVDSDGRAILNHIPSLLSNYQIAYFFGKNQAFLMDGNAESPGLGSIEPQTGGPFSASSLSGSMVGGVTREICTDQGSRTGWILFNGKGGFSVVWDEDDIGFSGADILSRTGTSYRTGTYTVAENGRGTFVYGQGGASEAFWMDGASEAFWMVSPDHIVTLGNSEFRRSPR